MSTVDATPRVHPDFVLQRLHAVAGVFPLGAYLCVHLLSHASMAWGGPEAWTRVSVLSRSLGAAVVTWTLVGIPLLFHALYGFVLVRRRGLSVGRFPVAGNVVQTLQVIASGVLAVFLMVHVTQMRIVPALRHAQLDLATVQRSVQPLLMLDVYVAGVLAAAFHLWAGAWTMLVRFGWTQTKASQRKMAWVCGVCGLVTAMVGVHAAAAFHDVRYVVP